MRQGSQRDHCSCLRCCSQADPAPGTPSPLEEVTGKQGLVSQGPMAHLIDSPQAEVSHMTFQPGPGLSCLHSNHSLPRLAPGLSPGHGRKLRKRGGRPWQGEGAQAAPGSCVAAALPVGIAAPSESLDHLFPQARACHGLHGVWGPKSTLLGPFQAAAGLQASGRCLDSSFPPC